MLKMYNYNHTYLIHLIFLPFFTKLYNYTLYVSKYLINISNKMITVQCVDRLFKSSGVPSLYFGRYVTLALLYVCKLFGHHSIIT